MKNKYLLSLALFFCSLLNSSFSFAQTINLWNGETPNVISCQYGNGAADNINPHSGSWAFKANLDQWNSSVIYLSCQDQWRIDLSNYSEIQFYIKTTKPDAIVKFGLTGWPYTSNMVDITPYVQNGPLNAQYKLVKIPIEVLKTVDYKLFSVEKLRFEAQTNAPFEIYVDDFAAIDNQPTQVDSIHFISDQTIKLNIRDKYDMLDVKNISNYQISSLDDPNYSSEQNPDKVGRHFYVKNFPEYSTNPVVKNEAFLILSAPLKNGKSYTLTVNNVKDLSGNNFSIPQQFNFTFNDTKLINHSVKVNQVGYFTNGPKYAYIGNYLGDAGVMDCNPSGFEIKNAQTGLTVFSGYPEIRGNDLNLSGEKVYQCNFSGFNIPGKYYVYVPGIGRSYDFKINDQVMDSVYYHTARSLFYQRCGVALNSPYADPRWSHAACHLNDGVSHTSWSNSLLYNSESINTSYTMPLGWHDAGDYGKYTMTGTTALYYLFTIYQLYPEKFADNELNIPESGNDVPDILDEAKHEILWLLNMQATDGGVFERVTTLAWPTSMPENDLATRYISEKTTHTTGQFAAIMAMAYRNFLPFWPDLAKNCLEKSKLAMNFLNTHLNVIPANGYNPGITGMGGGDYPDPEGDDDERAWAAAELYKSTGDINYRNLFDTYWTKHQAMWGWNPFQHHQVNASIAYATTSFPVDQTKVNKIKTDCINNAELELIPRTDNNFYFSACRTDVIGYIGWGAYGQSSKYSWDFIMAYYFSGNEKYKKYATLNLDVQLGNNPQNKTYITGIGSNYPMNPLHHPSLSDQVMEPVPGIPVFGPNSHLDLQNPYNIAVQDKNNLYPLGENENDPYPILRRYYDISSNVAMSEFNIIDEAIVSSVYSFFKPAPLSKPSQAIESKINYFKAAVELGKVKLIWETAAEKDISHFEVFRSKTGFDFENIANVNSWGNSLVDQQYQLLDTSPFSPECYYKLKSVNLDGTSDFSQILMVSLPASVSEGKKYLELYPNPVTDKINLSIKPADNSAMPWDLLITDFDQKLIFNESGDLISLNEQLNNLLDRLSPGVYVLQLKNKEESYKAKFIKK
ncbi:MAG: glycoside hydrolase family 9 protein [Sphingobacteriaceae bacterium]